MNRDKTGPLASREFWEMTWGRNEVRQTVFNPESRLWRPLHRFLQLNLPKREGLSLLEIGCYPGRFMWYFNQYFGYTVEGVEYIDWCCDRTREMLAREGVECRVHEADFTGWEPGRTWDIVASFGFIEHFANWEDVLAAQARLVSEKGLLVVSVPNLTGLYGRLCRSMMPDIYEMHQVLDCRSLADALERCDMHIIDARGVGGFNLSHTCLIEGAQKRGPVAWYAARGLKIVLELALQHLPLPESLAPMFVAVARRKLAGE